MEKVVSCIELVFENLESIVIPISRVKKMEFENIIPHETYYSKESDTFRSEHTLLEISYQHKSDLEYNSSDYEEPLGMFIANPTSNRVEDRPNILGRILNYRDLVTIQLLDNNRENIRDINVLWHEDDYEDNRYQSTEIKEGILRIEIGKPKEDKEN